MDTFSQTLHVPVPVLDHRIVGAAVLWWISRIQTTQPRPQSDQHSPSDSSRSESAESTQIRRSYLKLKGISTTKAKVAQCILPKYLRNLIVFFSFRSDKFVKFV